MDWIAKRIAEAKTAAPVGEAIVARLQRELAGAMRERALRNSELGELARDLLAATDPPAMEGAS